MARMFPSAFGPVETGDTGALGEQMVYEALRDMPEDWTVIHNCWRHLLKGDKESAEHISYEADFIVLIPGCGVLVIEVKNWSRARVRDGRWERWDSKSGLYCPVKHASPLNQAYLAAGNLREELKKVFSWGRYQKSNMEFRSLAVLLGKPENYENPCEIREERYAIDDLRKRERYSHMRRNEIYDWLYLCGEEALKDDLQWHIESLFCYGNNNTVEEMEAVRRYLLQNLVLRQDAATVNRIVELAAAPLAMLLPMLENSPGGFHIEGCAGSGKSCMLCDEAARLARQAKESGTGKRTLVLCYNLNLAEYLRGHKALRTAGVCRYDSCSPLVLDNFHTVANRICIWEGLPCAGEDGVFTSQTLHTLAERVKANPRYAVDAVFVDEAQDFSDEWWQVVQAMLRPGGKLYLFSDFGQRLYTHARHLPELPVRLRLRHNLRNTGQIACFAAASLTDKRAEQTYLPINGPEVELLPASDSPAVRAVAVRDCIERLQKEGFRLNDIVALTPWRKNTSLKEDTLTNLVDFPADGETRDKADKRLKRCAAASATRILGETIKAFKGMESLAVILTDISAPRDAENSGFTSAEFYVACTRARYRLIIIPTSSGAQFVRQCLPACQEDSLSIG